MHYCLHIVILIALQQHKKVTLGNLPISGASPPSDVTAVQTGPTSIRVTCTPPTPPGDTTGYVISYTSDSDSGNVTVSGGSTDMETLTGLQNGDTYTISIVATSETALPSESVPADTSVGLCELIQLCSHMYFLHIQFQTHQ